MRKKNIFLRGILLPLISGFLGGAVAIYLVQQSSLLPSPSSPPVGDSLVSSLPFKASCLDFEQGFIYAAEVASPAVVHVRTHTIVESRSPYSGTILEFFFGPQPNIRTPVSSTGSGVIIHEQGYIITNNHVVKGAARIEVRLSTKEVFAAQLIAADPSIDLALLKISPPSQLPVIPFGSSDSLRVGNWVLAIGNPFDLESTVTAGIVSAKARSLNFKKEKATLESFIQVDAAVNPGNSGGALVNLKGELVGINTAIASPTGTFAGYAFSIPETIVREFFAKHVDLSASQHGSVGLQFAEMTQRLADQLAAGNLRGVLVTHVEPNSLADASGVRSGDILLGVNSRPTNSVQSAYARLGQIDLGRKNRLHILRDRRAIEIMLASISEAEFN